MKLTDGLFLQTFYEVAKDYPGIEANDIIVDDLAMKLVSKPQSFDVVVLTNLQGDIMSDLCAGLVGGLGFAPSANIGENISIFEAVHGTAPDIMGRNIANPTALLLSGFMMLRHLGLMDEANLVENALLRTLEDGSHTGDFGDRSKPSLSTTGFAEAIIANLGKQPSTGQARASRATADFHLPVRPSKQKVMLDAHGSQAQTIKGVDVFFESSLTADEIAPMMLRHVKPGFKLVMIANRGTQVWPVGSIFTECVDQYRARFEAEEGTETNISNLLKLSEEIAADFAVASIEILRYFGGKPGYSLAPGPIRIYDRLIYELRLKTIRIYDCLIYELRLNQ